MTLKLLLALITAALGVAVLLVTGIDTQIKLAGVGLITAAVAVVAP